MQTGARLLAAVEILHEILDRGRPASLALSDWGRSHRFAGSGDRSAIGNLVYDCLRKKQSLAYAMGADTPRALVLGAMRLVWTMPSAEIATFYDGGTHHQEPLTSSEVEALAGLNRPSPPPWIAGDYPEWLHSSFSVAFGDAAATEGAALSMRAPVDMRVNSLKATPDRVLKAFARHGAVPAPFAPLGVRLPARQGVARSVNVEADPAHGKGWFEIQDEGSQIAALFAGPKAREQVADVCAGAGGKTLAFAAAMQNTGQIYAFDTDASRFRPIFERLKRAGARNVHTLQPGDQSALPPFNGRMDVVLVDAPCSGSGVWRRRPDAKWRLSPAQFQERQATQIQVLSLAAPLVKPGGVLAYVTCSVLPEENHLQVERFIETYPSFRALDFSEMTSRLNLKKPLPPQTSDMPGYLLTPSRHNTDGFYVAILQHRR